jgi:hypothetical protein
VKIARAVGGHTRQLSEGKLVPYCILNMGFTLDALTELEHPSLKLHDIQLTPPEARRLISLKYDFQPVTQNPEEVYE